MKPDSALIGRWVLAAALPWEGEAVRRGLLANAPRLRGAHSSTTGTTAGGARVTVMVCGMGAPDVDSAIPDDAAALVSVGCAGALDPSLASGHLVIAERVVGESGERFDCDPGGAATLAAAAGTAGLPHRRGSLLSSARVIASVAAKTGAARSTGALAVDMESVALAAAAQRRGISFMVARVILDSAATALEFAPRCIDAEGRLLLGGLAAALLDGRLRALRELRHLAAAKRTSETALTRFFASLSRRSLGA